MLNPGKIHYEMAERIPDPTTAGDFCRRFSAEHVETLQDIINEVRLKVWAQQRPEFFDAVIRRI